VWLHSVKSVPCTKFLQCSSLIQFWSITRFACLHALRLALKIPSHFLSTMDISSFTFWLCTRILLFWCIDVIPDPLLYSTSVLWSRVHSEPLHTNSLTWITVESFCGYIFKDCASVQKALLLKPSTFWCRLFHMARVCPKLRVSCSTFIYFLNSNWRRYFYILFLAWGRL